jgi:hypothetical protein
MFNAFTLKITSMVLAVAVFAPIALATMEQAARIVA